MYLYKMANKTQKRGRGAHFQIYQILLPASDIGAT